MGGVEIVPALGGIELVGACVFCIGFAGEIDIDEQYLSRGRFRCQLLCPGWSVRDVTGEIKAILVFFDI